MANSKQHIWAGVCIVCNRAVKHEDVAAETHDGIPVCNRCEDPNVLPLFVTVRDGNYGEAFSVGP